MWIHASRRYPLIAAVTLAVLVTGGAAGSAVTQASDPAPLTLRLTDFPRGWVVGDDTGCGPMGIEDATPDVKAIVLELHPQACVREFNKAWGSGKPFYVQSLAMTFEGSGGPERALTATRGMLAYHGLQGVSPSTTTVVIGDRLQVFVRPKGYPPGPQPSPETAVAWRSGEIYAFVVASAPTQSAATAAAVAYAQAQQARIATPTPVSDADFDDVEVGLDDPNVEVPVWWLGRSWDPPGTRPQIDLFEAGSGHWRPGVLPGQSVTLDYLPPRPWLPRARGGGSARIYVWKPKAWDHWRTKPYGQTAWKSPCARSRTLHVAAGRAVIWSGWWKTPTTKPCPAGAPDTHFAHVYGRGYVITVNIPLCNGRNCERERSTNPYETPAGLETVVRALRRR